ncbi:hypothetical protein IW249_002425 [Micromonospora vinacea]|uniref:Uncharacterized protein n=1 Tax=Micromonospora vinacea TaxID=709878 RepID=A0ABS0K075_9ACTN|nr:hypothetical protein [Micromonospora vinacea]MBG6102011.1 hypothetical protein [Micromonospora vinacea]
MDRSALTRFQRLPAPQIEVALDAILDAHLAVSAAGLVAVDLYDGCFLYDFAATRRWPPAHRRDPPAGWPGPEGERRRSPQAWRGNSNQRRVVERATRQAPAARYPDVPALVRAWRLATP